MKRIRLGGLTFMIVCAVSAIATASASPPAFEFRAETYPVEVRGTNTNINRFEIAGAAVVLCEKATLNTNEEGAPNPTKASRTLEVHPIYGNPNLKPPPAGEKCFLSLAALKNNAEAVIRTTGCNYVLTAIKPGEKNGPIAIKCAPGKTIEIESLGVLGCVITIGSQALEGIEYVNEAGPPKRVRVNAHVEKIRYKASSQCGLGILEGENGAYRGESGLEGFKPATREADGVEVSAHPPH